MVIATLYGLANTFFQGTVIILLALIINPNKVVPFLDKKEETNVKEEIIDNKDE